MIVGGWGCVSLIQLLREIMNNVLNVKSVTPPGDGVEWGLFWGLRFVVFRVVRGYFFLGWGGGSRAVHGVAFHVQV